MVNQYMHDYNNVETIITSLKNIKKNYEDKIDEIKKLVIDIEGSSSWVDQTIKTSFINCCNQYVTLYGRVISGMDVYITYLEKKSKAALELETAYSRGA